MQAGNGEKPFFAFGAHKLDPLSRMLFRDGEEVRIAQRPFDILLELIENRDRVITRAELLDRFWDGREVYDDALRKCIGSIRKALGDTGRPSRIIETRYGGGYRFIADVETISADSNDDTAKAETLKAVSNSDEGRSKFSPLFRPFAVAAAILLLALLTLGFYVFAPRATPPGPAAGDASNSIRRIAVMPLKNLTGRSETEYFSDGVTDSIITELARSGELKVISRGSTFSFKNREMDAREIGSQLGVDALLEGTVQGQGEVVNVRVRLINARDGSVIWTSNDFERDLSAAADLQDAIACNVARELRTQLCGPDSDNATRNGIAYQEYLKGRFEWNKRTAAGIKKSIEHFNRAIKYDPNYSRAYSGLSESYSMGFWYVPFSTQFALPKATDTARKAIELDQSSAEARTALASVALLSWRWNEAGEELRRALEIDPNYARALHVSAFYLTAIGRYEEAIAAIRKAGELDPLNVVIRADAAHILLHGHEEDPTRIDAAIAECDRLIASEPSYAEAYEYRAAAYMLKNESSRFAADLIEGKRLRGESGLDRYSSAFRTGGQAGLVRQLLADELRSARSGSPRPVRLGTLYAALGESDNAVKWLKKAVDERDAEIISISQNVWLTNIRKDHRLLQLLTRVGLAQ